MPSRCQLSDFETLRTRRASWSWNGLHIGAGAVSVSDSVALVTRSRQRPSEYSLRQVLYCPATISTVVVRWNTGAGITAHTQAFVARSHFTALDWRIRILSLLCRQDVFLVNILSIQNRFQMNHFYYNAI